MELEKEIQQSKFKNEYQKLILNVLYTSGWLSSLQTQYFRPYKISVQQYNILRILRGQYPNPATVNLLKDRMLDKMSNASRLVEKLRLKGLIERHQCEKDRRAVDVVITDKGLNLLKELDSVVERWDELFSHVTIEEAKETNRILDKMRG
ncbi:MAG: MarR family transcriptional regulator [Calditrichia bacterium]|nr:MarR family transcriptional regulator [Calditrichota bacterium]MCB0269569.1 MarR family transcriptional regulator [Calditrichota bacterium]MCB9070526.1 MarR family transcriptional regulator [Calditrichia bacterium]